MYFGLKSLSPEGGLRLFPRPQPTSLWVAAASGLAFEGEQPHSWKSPRRLGGDRWLGERPPLIC